MLIDRRIAVANRPSRPTSSFAFCARAAFDRSQTLCSVVVERSGVGIFGLKETDAGPIIVLMSSIATAVQFAAAAFAGRWVEMPSADISMSTNGGSPIDCIDSSCSSA